MICAAGHAATIYSVPHPLHAVEVTVPRCHPCRREYVVGRDGGGQWLRRAGFCDGCDAPTWHFVTHPRYGHEILLWPKPATLFAYLLTPDGPGHDVFRDYCPACCPAFGETPRRVIAEVDGVPVATTACIDHVTAQQKYAFHFSELYGAWLAAWLTDHLALPDDERDRLMTQWESDCAEGKSAALTEHADG